MKNWLYLLALVVGYGLALALLPLILAWLWIAHLFANPAIRLGVAAACALFLGVAWDWLEDPAVGWGLFAALVWLIYATAYRGD